VNARFFNNVCDELGSDVGGGAIRKLDYLIEPGVGPKRPVWVVNSTFGGPDAARNRCSNGGGISSIGVSWTIINSRFRDNDAIGTGANPPKNGLPGGGSTAPTGFVPASGAAVRPAAGPRAGAILPRRVPPARSARRPPYYATAPPLTGR